MSESRRTTKKSRLVEEFSECIVDLVAAGNNAPTKADIVNCVVSNSLHDGVSVAIKTMLEDETANELERYFTDAIKVAANCIDRPWHYVNKKFYKGKFPESEEAARQMLVTFANGRTQKAHGVRFVLEDGPDVFIGLQADKAQARVKGQVKNYVEDISSNIEKGVLANDRVQLIGK